MTKQSIVGTSKSVAALVAGAAFFAPVLALAWHQAANFGARIHGHEFSRITAESSSCALKLSVFFEAPEGGYKHASPDRNTYSFRARIKFDGGRVVLTRPFSNAGPGARVYSYVEDTTEDACWAKAERKVQGVDVEGCRGARCTPEPFK